MLGRLTEAHLKRLNIGRRYWEARIRQIPGSAQYRSWIINYVNELDRMRIDGSGLYLYGPNGSGKTHIASAILIVARIKGYTGYALQAQDFHEAVIKKLPFDEDQTILDRAKSVDFLLLDDVGKEYTPGGSGWKEAALENLFRHRAKELKPIILTSNLSPEEFKARYLESAVSILRSCTLTIEILGEDHRRVDNERLRKELTV